MQVGRTGSRFVYRSHVYIAYDGISELKRLSEPSELFEAYLPRDGTVTQSVGPQGRTRRLVGLISWTCWWVLGKNYADR